MTEFNWQPSTPIDAITFDCDGTLSHIEGIDVLANQNGVGEAVHQLTLQAMNETGITRELYKQRISLVKPNRHQLIELGKLYYDERANDLLQVLDIFKHLNKEIFVISAGLNPAVKIFASLLDIVENNVFAVDVKFDQVGEFADYDHGAPTTDRDGKHEIVECLCTKYPRIVHIGDGMNDYDTHEAAESFIGFGGVSHREKIAKLSDYYIKSSSLTPMLPLCLTAAEVLQLSASQKVSYQQGLDLIQGNQVVMNKAKR